MNRAIEWLLNLAPRSLAGDGSLEVRFASPPAAWIMLIGAVLSVFFVVRTYRREPVSGRVRVALISLRFAAVMTVLFMLAEPQVVLRRTQVAPGQVAVLIDSSASMARRDGDRRGEAPPAAAVAGSGASRAATNENDATGPSRLEAALQAASSQGRLGRSLAGHEVSYWTFSEGLTRLADLSPQGVRDAGPGSQTDLASAISGVLAAMQGARLASVIVVSDGRQTTPSPLAEALAQAEARRVPVHTIGAGSWRPLRDVRIDSVWHEDDVFVQDLVTLRVQLEARGLEDITETTVELQDPQTGAVLSSFRGRLSPAQRHASWDLQYRPAQVGRRLLGVAVQPIPGEADVTNNRAEVSIRAHDQKIRVLYVEGPPRFEYRFLKNLLVREPTIECSILLLSASSGFAQEGSRPIQRFPASLEELSGYDVVLLGDFDARREERFSDEQQQWLVEFVSSFGGGVGVIAGPNFVPHVLRQTPLEKLLPVVLESQWSAGPGITWHESWRPRLTREGEQSGLFRFEEDRDENAGVLKSLAGWYFFAPVLGAQPGATVLAAHPTEQCGSGPMPVVVLGRYGAGRTLYVGSDDLWRWREYGGDRYYESFWLGSIRALARGRKFGLDRPWRLETDRKRYELGEPVQARLTVRDPSARLGGDEATVLVSDAAGAVDRVTLAPASSAEGVWEGTFVSTAAGVLTLSAGGGPLSASAEPPTCVIEVEQVDAESREPSADRRMLQQIASRTGGRSAWLTDPLDSLSSVIPDRSVETPDDLELPMWDTRLMVVLLTMLLSCEWVLRRAKSLP